MRKRTAAAQSKYKRHRNILNRLIKKTKLNYYKQQLDSSGNKSKIIWSVINEILSKRKKGTSIEKVKKWDGTATTSPMEMANIFNEHYVNVGKKL